MYLLVFGIVLLVFKLADAPVVASWPWWGVLLPFPLVAVWWAFADWSGYTKKRAEEREEARRVARIRRQIAAAARRKPRH